MADNEQKQVVCHAMGNFAKFTNEHEAVGVYKDVKGGAKAVEAALRKDIEIVRSNSQKPFYRIVYRGGDLLLRLGQLDAKKAGGGSLNVDQCYWRTFGMKASESGATQHGGRLRIQEPLDHKAAKAEWIDKYGVDVLDGFTKLALPKLRETLARDHPDDPRYKDMNWLEENNTQSLVYLQHSGLDGGNELMFCFFAGGDCQVFAADDHGKKFDKQWEALQAKVIREGIGAPRSGAKPGEKRGRAAAFSDHHNPALIAPIIRIGGFSFFKHDDGRVLVQLRANMVQATIAQVTDPEKFAPKLINPLSISPSKSFKTSPKKAVGNARVTMIMDDDDE